MKKITSRLSTDMNYTGLPVEGEPNPSVFVASNLNGAAPTVLSPEQYKVLEKDPTFNTHLKNGFITVEDATKEDKEAWENQPAQGAANVALHETDPNVQAAVERSEGKKAESGKKESSKAESSKEDTRQQDSNHARRNQNT